MVIEAPTATRAGVGSSAVEVAHAPHETDAVELRISWPWWLRPAVALLGLTGVMALVASRVSPVTYQQVWQEPKFLTGHLEGVLLIGIVSMFGGIMLTSATVRRGGTATLRITLRQLQFLGRAYRVLLWLTLLGYALWWGNAFLTGGVGLSNLAAVLGRDTPEAIGSLKAASRPISGVTTITQFGPVAICLGALLRKVGHGDRQYRWLIVLALGRVFFYAERLALLEVTIPLLVIGCLTVTPEARRRHLLTRAGPLFAVPAIWVLFAVSEYFRSWVYYQQFTDQSFPAWVSLRLLGYYTTSFNNSALMARLLVGSHASPYYTPEALWTFPLSGAVIHAPTLEGMSPPDWWASQLTLNANPAFNNTGSFLVGYGEMDAVSMAIFYGLLGLAIGFIFSRLTRGSVPAMIAYSTLFVGILELSRFTYWTLGRCTPVILACLWIAVRYPSQTDGVKESRRRH